MKTFPLAVLSIPLAALALACQAAGPEPPTPDPLRLGLEHYPGSALEGVAVDRELAVDLDQTALGVELEVRWQADLGGLEVEPLGSHARRVWIEPEEDPIRVTLTLAGTLGLASRAPAAADWRRVQEGVLFEGTTVAFSLAPVLEEGFPETGWESLRLHVTRPERVARAELTLEVAAPPAESDVLGAGALHASDRPAPREWIALDSPLSLERELAWLVLPAVTVEAPRGGFLVALRLSEGAPRDATEALAEVEEARERAVSRRSDLEDVEIFVRETSSALEALVHARHRREALLFLADASHAPLVADLAIVGRDADLEDLTARLAVLGDEAEGGAIALGWWLEEAAWLTLCEASASDEGLPPGLEALLLQHAGQAGRFPGLLVESLRASDGVATFRKRLVAENRIFLEDGSPAARVRAFDWLLRRGEEPAGYDPLAQRTARREALALAREAEAEGAEGR